MPKGIFKPKYTKSEVSQRFNLKQLLGYEPSNIQREFFHDLVNERIEDRTKDGRDINNKKFRPYSSEYAEFKGVSRGDVDLTLNDNMLQSFDDSNSAEQANIVKVQMKPGTQTLKAFNHNTGDTLPQRTFFGVNNKRELEPLLREVDELRPVQDGSITLANLLTALESLSIRREDDGEV